MIRVELQGMRALQRAMDSSPQVTAEHMQDAVKKAVEQLRNEVVKRTPVDTGTLRKSIGTKTYKRGASVVGEVGSSLSLSKDAKGYLEPVETGTRPHWPPVGALQPWAKRHGLPSGSAGDFLVRRAISRSGTKGAHMFEEGYKAGKDKVGRYFQDALNKVARDLAK